MIATLTGAFYFLLPQLANVDDSVEALRSANWGWLAGCGRDVRRAPTSQPAIGMLGGVSERAAARARPSQAQLASSFVNRVTPANVGGMALNVRYMQKAGVPPAEAVTGIGLNVLAGGIVHIVLLIVFFAWAGAATAPGSRSRAAASCSSSSPSCSPCSASSLATRRGRRSPAGARARRSCGSRWPASASLARSPRRLFALFGGSVGVTLAYIAALTCAVNAFDGGSASPRSARCTSDRR